LMWTSSGACEPREELVACRLVWVRWGREDEEDGGVRERGGAATRAPGAEEEDGALRARAEDEGGLE
jgi:hypothetical protein